MSKSKSKTNSTDLTDLKVMRFSSVNEWIDYCMSRNFKHVKTRTVKDDQVSLVEGMHCKKGVDKFVGLVIESGELCLRTYIAVVENYYSEASGVGNIPMTKPSQKSFAVSPLAMLIKYQMSRFGSNLKDSLKGWEALKSQPIV